MQFLLGSDIYWIVKILVWVVLVFFCLRNALIRRYPLLCGFIIWDIAWSLIFRYAVANIPRDGLAYACLYYTRYLLTTLWGHLILLRTYFLFGRFSWRRDWHLFAVPLVIAGLATGDLSRTAFAGWLAVVGNSVTVYFGMAAMWRMRGHREIDLGWNMRLVLLAFTIPAGFAALVFMASSVGVVLPAGSLRVWSRAIALGFWIIMAVAMVEYSPPRVTGPNEGGIEATTSDELADGKAAAEKGEVRV